MSVHKPDSNGYCACTECHLRRQLVGLTEQCLYWRQQYGATYESLRQAKRELRLALDEIERLGRQSARLLEERNRLLDEQKEAA